MPIEFVNMMAQKHNKTKAEAERLWDKAKRIVRKEYDYDEDSDDFWKVVTDIFKTMAGDKSGIALESFEQFLIRQRSLGKQIPRV